MSTGIQGADAAWLRSCRQGQARPQAPRHGWRSRHRWSDGQRGTEPRGPQQTLPGQDGAAGPAPCPQGPSASPVLLSWGGSSPSRGDRKSRKLVQGPEEWTVGPGPHLRPGGPHATWSLGPNPAALHRGGGLRRPPWASGSSPVSQGGGSTRHRGEPLAGGHPAGRTSFRWSLRCLLSSALRPGQGPLWGSPGDRSTHVSVSLTPRTLSTATRTGSGRAVS